MQPEKVNANANKVHTKAKFHLKYMEDDNISSIILVTIYYILQKSTMAAYFWCDEFGGYKFILRRA